jgi:preprotein translocase subunit SecG
MPKTQVILGIVFIIIGLLLELIPVAGWIYGTLLIVVGIALLIFRNAEDEIEQIKGEKKK